MPTFDVTEVFRKELASLEQLERARFQNAVAAFVEDLRNKRGFRPGLRVRGVKGAAGVYEMTWAPDGRATFEHGQECGQVSRTSCGAESARTTSCVVLRAPFRGVALGAKSVRRKNFRKVSQHPRPRGVLGPRMSVLPGGLGS